MNRLIYNAIRTPDGTVLESRHVHDFKEYTDKNGRMYAVDGGTSYPRRVFYGFIDYEELSVYLGDGHKAVREACTWGTYGVNGDEPLSYVKLKDMSSEHIQACLDNVKYMDLNYREAFENELMFRKESENV